MPAPTSAAHRIREHLLQVEQLRHQAHTRGQVAAVQAVKAFQAQRFRATYADFLAHPRFAAATRFFLEELYGTPDFAQRDAQFGRIAGAIERLFPDTVVELAVDLAEIHALTEVFDHAMALHWMHTTTHDSARYVICWRFTAARAERERQLAAVLRMGQALQRMTRMRSLRLTLRMMRKPAQAAGLSALQQFLEGGFEAFGTMGDASPLLTAIQQREQAWIHALFDMDAAAIEHLLDTELRRA